MAAQTQKTNSHRGLIITIIVLVAVIAIGYFTMPLLMAQLNVSSQSSSGVVYKVEGTAEQAVLTYTKPDGSIIQPKGVDLPWTSFSINIPSGTIVVLTAAGVGEGTVKCTITVGGRVLDSNIANPFNDKAICGAVIR